MKKIIHLAATMVLITFTACKKDSVTGVATIYGNWKLDNVVAVTTANVVTTQGNDTDSLLYTTIYTASGIYGDLNFTSSAAITNNIYFSSTGIYNMEYYINGTYGGLQTNAPYGNGISSYSDTLNYQVKGNDSLYFPKGGLIIYQSAGDYTVPAGPETYQYQVINDTLKLTSFITATQSVPGQPSKMTVSSNLRFHRK